MSCGAVRRPLGLYGCHCRPLSSEQGWWGCCHQRTPRRPRRRAPCPARHAGGRPGSPGLLPLQRSLRALQQVWSGHQQEQPAWAPRQRKGSQRELGSWVFCWAWPLAAHLGLHRCLHRLAGGSCSQARPAACPALRRCFVCPWVTCWASPSAPLVGPCRHQPAQEVSCRQASPASSWLPPQGDLAARSARSLHPPLKASLRAVTPQVPCLRCTPPGTTQELLRFQGA